MRVRVLARIVASLMISASMSAGAVSISLQDSCSKSMGGSLGAGVVVDPGSGNLATTQLSATYTAGVGSCIPLAADNKPICVLSASETAIAVGRTISLYANCSSTPQSLAWTLPFGGPTPAAISGTPNAFSLTLPTTGVYTYAVTGSNGGGAGPTSTPVTILVGDNTQAPNCVLTASPAQVVANQKSNLQVVCRPLAGGTATP